MGGLEDRIRLGLFAEMQKNQVLTAMQAKRVGALPVNIIADNPILLLAYAIGVNAGLTNALTIVDYAKLADILSCGNSPFYGGDRALP